MRKGEWRRSEESGVGGGSQESGVSVIEQEQIIIEDTVGEHPTDAN
jgi:hypothetical protein